MTSVYTNVCVCSELQWWHPKSQVRTQTPPDSRLPPDNLDFVLLVSLGPVSPAGRKDWFALNERNPLLGRVDLGIEDQYQYLVFACFVLSPECHGKAQNRVLLGHAPHCSVGISFSRWPCASFLGLKSLLSRVKWQWSKVLAPAFSFSYYFSPLITFLYLGRCIYFFTLSKCNYRS